MYDKRQLTIIHGVNCFCADRIQKRAGILLFGGIKQPKMEKPHKIATQESSQKRGIPPPKLLKKKNK